MYFYLKDFKCGVWKVGGPFFMFLVQVEHLEVKTNDNFV